MSSLFLDLASHDKLFALADESHVLASAPVPDRTPESELMPILERVCSESGIALSEISRICSVTGPGGFMSLRVATAFANALSWSIKIPLAGMHLSDLWHGRSTHYQLPTTHYLWLHSTKKDALFIRGFGDLEKEWSAPSLISIEELRSKLIAQSSSLSFVGELIPEHRALFPHLTPLAGVLHLTNVLPTLLSSQSYDEKSLSPWYGRGA